MVKIHSQLEDLRHSFDESSLNKSHIHTATGLKMVILQKLKWKIKTKY